MSKEIKKDIYSFLKRNWGKSFNPLEIANSICIKNAKWSPELTIWICLGMMSREGLVKQVKKCKDIYSCKFCA